MSLVVVPLLVTDTQELQVKRSRMTHIGTYFTPLCGHITIGKLHKVEGILDIGIQVFKGNMYARLGWIGILELTAQSTRDNGQWLGTDVLSQLEELKEAQSIRLIVVWIVTEVKGMFPAVLIQRTVFYGTYRVFPLITSCQVSTLHDASTREAENARMQVFQSLCQVATHTILTVLIGIDREQRHMLQTYFVSTVQEDAQFGMLQCFRSGQRNSVFLPFLGGDIQFLLSELLLLIH